MAVDRFPIEEGHVLMFCRSIGDQNPAHVDHAAAAGSDAGALLAPPTFVQAGAQFDPDYGLRPHPDRVWFGSGRNASGRSASGPGSGGGSSAGGGGGGGGGLHAEQHYEYHRPVRVGDVLTATTHRGESWEKEGRRGGKLLFSESVTEYRDQNGDLVVTARSVGVRTAKPVEQ